MYSRYPQPAIIGAGLTGLLISLALSRARIGHILIGGPPPADGPRLGESLSVEATLYFLAEYPELADCFYKKQFATAYMGDLSSHLDFAFLQSLPSILVFGSWGKRPPESVIHVDRVRFDAALYEKAISSPFCTHTDSRVVEVCYETRTDRIQHLVLENGTHIPVSHVFDATGHIRLLARHLHIPRRMLGATQRVAYGHYYRRDPATVAHPFGESQPESTWHLGTGIVRLYKERYGIDAMAWCIPLGSTISVGITTPRENQQQSDETLLEYAQDAFGRYGNDFARFVDTHSRIGRAQMEFYTHACAYGANWLLTAAAHTQIWWTSSTGLDAATAAARACVPFLRAPKRVGAQYQEYLEPLAQSHALWDAVATHRYGVANEAGVSRFNSRLFWSITNRLIKSFRLEGQNPLLQNTTELVLQAQGLELWSQLPAPHSVRRVNTSHPVPLQNSQ